MLKNLSRKGGNGGVNVVSIAGRWCHSWGSIIINLFNKVKGKVTLLKRLKT